MIALPLSTAHAQQPVASAGDIVAALGACIAATSLAGIDETKLSGAGFMPGAAQAKGKAVETPLRFFGRPNNAAMIVALAEPNPICTVLARIPNLKSFPATVESVSRALQTQPILQKGNEVAWRRGTSFIQLAATGTRENPSIRTAVMAMPEEKK